MAHSIAVAAPSTDRRSDSLQRYSPVEVARQGSATIVRLVVPETLSAAGRIFSELTDLAIAGRGRLVICLCKASECTKEWLAALASLSRRCEVLGGRLIVCGNVDPLEQDSIGTTHRSKMARGRRNTSRRGDSRERSSGLL